ncbi:MAG: hypothetical protein ACP5MC_00040 [Candidatus Micrarchaeia archaeon]
MAENSNEINFLDVVCILRITPDMTEEKFSGAINASYFDAANLVGTLKQKGLIDINSGFPGPTSIVLTDSAKALLNDLNARSSEPLDVLDSEILRQLSGGKRLPMELQSTLNLVSKDLAYRLYKLYKQNLLTYELRNGNVELLLTEQGFLKANATSLQAPAAAQPQQQVQQGVAGAQAQQATGPQQQSQQTQEINQMQNELVKPKQSRKANIMVLVVAVVVIVLAVLLGKHII